MHFINYWASAQRIYTHGEWARNEITPSPTSIKCRLHLKKCCFFSIKILISKHGLCIESQCSKPFHLTKSKTKCIYCLSWLLFGYWIWDLEENMGKTIVTVSKGIWMMMKMDKAKTIVRSFCIFFELNPLVGWVF